MANVNDLKISITELSHKEAITLLQELRANRRNFKEKSSSRKRKQKISNKVQLEKMFVNLSPEQSQEMLKLLGEINED